METAPDEYPLLIAQEGPLKGQRWILSRTLVVGRDVSCDVIIPDRQVSRYHARLTPTSAGVLLEDLDSKNGTHCNGTDLKSPVVLQDGDVIQIALVQEFTFLTSDATVPLSDRSSQGSRLVLDLRSRRVWINQKLLSPPLSAQQFRLLSALYERQGQVINRPELVTIIWGDENALGVSDQALDALIRRLRERLAALDATHQYIEIIRGHGVRLDNPSL